MYIFKKNNLCNAIFENELQKINPRTGGTSVRWSEDTRRITAGSESVSLMPLTAAGTFLPSADGKKVYEDLLKMPLISMKVCESGGMGKFVAVSVLAAVLSTSIVSKSLAVSCKFTESGTNSKGNTTYSLVVNGAENDTVFTVNSCNGQYSHISTSSWDYFRQRITSVTFDDNITTIGANAFNGARDLTNVVMPKVETIGAYAFDGTTNLKNINFPDSLSSIGNGAFWGTGLTSVIIPDGVTNIGNSAFMNASFLNSISIPDSVITFGDGAFSSTNITSLTISDSWDIDKVSNWRAVLFGNYPRVQNINCVNNSGEEGEEKKCLKIIEDFLPDEDGNCKTGIYVCFNNIKQIGNTCLGKFLTNTTNSNNGEKCIYETWCNAAHNYVNTYTRECVTLADCTGEFIPDTVNKKCLRLPGCGTFENGKCTTCTQGYLTNSEGTCTLAVDCNNGLHADNGACVANDDVNCNTQKGNKCAECKSGYLEQGGGCVTSCGAGYKQFENWCNRVQYTPAEAAAVLTDDNTNSVTITFKK